MNIPNILTFLRILLGPLFIYVFLQEGDMFIWYSFIVAFLIEITDLFDGYIARKYKQVTDLGKIIDPVADRIARYSVFLAFLVLSYANVWMLALIFYRDCFVSAIRILASAKGRILAARFSGKIKATAQGVGIVAILLLRILSLYNTNDLFGKDIITNNDDLVTASIYIMWGITAITLLSFIDYALANRKIIIEIIKGGNCKDQ